MNAPPVRMICAASFVLLGVTFALRPAEAGAQAQVGVKGGVVLAQLYGDDVGPGSIDYRLGYAGGLFVGLPVGDVVSIQLEGLYAQKGAKQAGTLDLPGGQQVVEATWKYDYVDAGVHLKVRLASTETASVSLFGGANASFLVSAEIEGEGGSADLKEDLTKEMDLGLTVGGEVGVGPMVFDLRSQFGMSEIDEPPLSDVFSRKQNIVLQAMIGFVFGGG